jgi:hypothetical protein
MTTDSLPITVLIPEGPSAPIELYDQHAALKLAIVEREGVGSLSPPPGCDQFLTISSASCMVRP